jgi:hypothetical protein
MDICVSEAQRRDTEYIPKMQPLFLGSNFLHDTKTSVTLDLLIGNLVNGQDSDCPETRIAYQAVALVVLTKPLIKAVD